MKKLNKQSIEFFQEVILKVSHRGKNLIFSISFFPMVYRKKNYTFTSNSVYLAILQKLWLLRLNQ